MGISGFWGFWYLRIISKKIPCEKWVSKVAFLSLLVQSCWICGRNRFFFQSIGSIFFCQPPWSIQLSLSTYIYIYNIIYIYIYYIYYIHITYICITLYIVGGLDNVGWTLKPLIILEESPPKPNDLQNSLLLMLMLTIYYQYYYTWGVNPI